MLTTKEYSFKIGWQNRENLTWFKSHVASNPSVGIIQPILRFLIWKNVSLQRESITSFPVYKPGQYWLEDSFILQLYKPFVAGFEKISYFKKPSTKKETN